MGGVPGHAMKPVVDWLLLASFGLAVAIVVLAVLMIIAMVRLL